MNLRVPSSDFKPKYIGKSVQSKVNYGSLDFPRGLLTVKGYARVAKYKCPEFVDSSCSQLHRDHTLRPGDSDPQEDQHS